MKYRGKDIKSYLRHECINTGDVVILGRRSCNSIDFSKSKLHLLTANEMVHKVDKSNLVYATSQKRKQCISMAKNQLINEVVDNYSIARRNVTGYKMMYLKGTTSIDFERAEIFFPVLVEVEIPKNSLIYEDPEESKCRATKGKIKEILDPNIMRSKYVRIMVVIGRNRWFVRAQIFKSLVNDDCYILSVEPEPSWLEVIRGSFDRNICHDEMNCVYRVNNVRDDIVYSMFEAQKICEINSRAGLEYSLHHVPYSLEQIERHVGDIIDESDNFDMRPIPCTSGFHFFKEPKEAVDYVSIVYR